MKHKWENKNTNPEFWQEVARTEDATAREGRTTHRAAVPGGDLYQVTVRNGEWTSVALCFVPNVPSAPAPEASAPFAQIDNAKPQPEATLTVSGAGITGAVINPVTKEQIANVKK